MAVRSNRRGKNGRRGVLDRSEGRGRLREGEFECSFFEGKPKSNFLAVELGYPSSIKEVRTFVRLKFSPRGYGRIELESSLNGHKVTIKTIITR